MGVPVIAFDTVGGMDALGQSDGLIDPFDIGAMKNALMQIPQRKLEGILTDEIALRKRRNEISADRAVERFDALYQQTLKTEDEAYESQPSHNYV